jgi:hypothetical protein
MDAFARWVIRLRWWIIVAVVLLTAAAGVAIAKWAYIEADFSKYLPEDDPVVKRFQEAGDRFGGVAVAMVGVEFDDVFRPQALRCIDELSRIIGRVDGVNWVVSLTEMDDVQAEEIDGEPTVAVRPVVDPQAIPTRPEALAELRDYVLGKEELVGVVVDAEGKLANLTFSIAGDADRVEVANAVKDAIAGWLAGRKLPVAGTRVEPSLARPAGLQMFYFGGFPYWMKNMSEIILADMLVLVPVVSLVVIGILFLSFRSLRGVLLPLATVIISATWAMGLLSALGLPITMLSNVIPVLLIALGTAYAIHLLHKVDEVRVGDGEPHEKQLRRAMVDVMVPIGLAGLTTVVGFLSFLTSNLVFIQHTGLMAAFGIFSAMLVALTLLPAVLSLLKPSRTQRRGDEQDSGGVFGWILAGLGALALRASKTVIALAVVVALVAAAFIPQIDRQFNMVAYFPKDSPVRRADVMMKQKLGGNVPIWITVAGDPKHPFVLGQMLSIEKFLRTIEDVSNVRSVASLIAEMNQVMFSARSIPATERGVGNLWFNLEGKSVLKQFVDQEEQHALIQGVSSESDTGRLRVIVAEVEDFLDRLPSRATAVELAGAPAGLAERARAARLDRVALNTVLDLRFRLPEREWKLADVRAWLVQARTSPAGPAPAAEYRQAIQAFLLSDESDMLIEDEALAAALAEAVAERSAERGRLQRERLEGLIRQTLPAPLVADDPKGPGYLSKSLAVLVDDITDARRSRLLLEELLARLPAEAAADERLRADLRGDLAPFNTRRVFLPLAPDEQPPAGGQVVAAEFAQTGMHHISVNVDNRLVYSQLSSLGLAGLVAMVLLMIQFRSLLAGLLGMIPMVVTLLVNFGTMAALGIRLDSATVLIASLVVGVGIDYTIHFLSRTRLELVRSGEPAGALALAQRTAGRAILINAITVTAGQLVFLAAELIPLHYFGALLALAMVTSALAAVTVMPAVLIITRPSFLRRKGRLQTEPRTAG